MIWNSPAYIPKAGRKVVVLTKTDISEGRFKSRGDYCKGKHVACLCWWVPWDKVRAWIYWSDFLEEINIRRPQ